MQDVEITAKRLGWKQEINPTNNGPFCPGLFGTITERELRVGSEWQRRGFCGAHRLAPAGTGCGEGTAGTGCGVRGGRAARSGALRAAPTQTEPGKEGTPLSPTGGGDKITKSHAHAHLNIVQTCNVFTADRKKKNH